MTTLIAQWNWRVGDPTPRNVLMQFRRAFNLKAIGADARLHLSADTRYLLSVNGVRLGHGPALFLASDEAGLVNGATLMVDGGRSVLYHESQEAQAIP